MNLDRAIAWLAENKNRHIAPASLQKATLARLNNYGLQRDRGLYYPL